jgi:hypothetical protein
MQLRPDGWAKQFLALLLGNASRDPDLSVARM